MGIKYRTLEKHANQVFVRDFEGTVTVDDIIESWNGLLTSGRIDKTTRGVVNNLTACQLDMNMDSFQKLIGFLKSKEELKKLKLAVVCNNPEAIIFPTMGEMKEKSLKIKPFSYEQNALEWIVGKLD